MKKSLLLAAASMATLLSGCVVAPIDAGPPHAVVYGPPPPAVVVVRPYGYYGYHRGYWGPRYHRW